MQRILAGLTLFAPTGVWAGFNIGKNLDYWWVALLVLVVTAVMGLMLLVSLFTGSSRTGQSFWVCAADLLVTVILVAVGDVLCAYATGAAGGALLFLTLLVYFGESMLEASKAKQRSSARGSRKSSAHDPR